MGSVYHRLVALWIIAGIVVILLPPVIPLRAQSGETGADIVAAVNDYRVANGQPALAIDSALMAAAQSHADWMAANNFSIGSHQGAGGSMPGDRALAAGYVGGGGVRENVASGDLNYISVYYAVDIWIQSKGHRLTMLMNAEHIGAGTARTATTQFYVLLIGDPSGAGLMQLDDIMRGAGAPPGYPPDSNTEAARPVSGVEAPRPVSTPYRMVPIVQAEPDEGGTITHTVQIGQTAWDIAMVYHVDLEDLLALNGLRRPVVLHPGDQLIIRLGPAATPPALTLRTHTVRANESAWTIATMYGLTLDQLLAINHLERPAILHPGDIVIVQLPPTATPTPPEP